MEAINNETARAILQLIGPGGVGLLFYCAAASYAWYSEREEKKKAQQTLLEMTERNMTVFNEFKNVLEKLLERVK